MGNSDSTPITIDTGLLNSWYTTAVNNNVLPDIGIDKSLQTFSFADSDVALQRHFFENLAKANIEGKVSGYFKDVGQALAPFTRAPRSMGITAVVISMILDLFVSGADHDVPAALQRVFNNEKAKDVLVTMEDYRKQLRIHINDPGRMLLKTELIEHKLSDELTSLRHVMMVEEMRSTYLKSWVNGAAFHVLLLANIANMKHAERCDCLAGQQETIRNAIEVYLEKLHGLMDKYKEYKLKTTFVKPVSQLTCRGGRWCSTTYRNEECDYGEVELNKRVTFYCPDVGGSIRSEYYRRHHEEYITRTFSSPGQITGLPAYFDGIRSNLNALMTRRAVFRVPDCREVQRSYPDANCY